MMVRREGRTRQRIDYAADVATWHCLSSLGTAIIAWTINNDYLDHMWFIDGAGEPDTYVIQNTVGGSYMDMSKSSSDDGTPIIGFHKTSPGNNQKWIIKEEASGSGHWKIQNKATGTFVDLLNGGGGNGNQIVGWQGSWHDATSLGHQHWTFQPRSLPGNEIHATLRANHHLRQDFKSYKTDCLYLVLSREHIEDIWRNSVLKNRKWRCEIFDCDDFAFVYKGEVCKWAEANFKADARGFAVVCGIMFGTNDRGRGHAYNWMIDPDNHSSIIFFEPQNSSFKENPGYDAYFGVF
ncbi:carbohydrate-binding module family 13 protein [Trametes sanguinea]|nr:carbohydrate-binding module family 13 protein [Trametes sanguinea]